jgi:hypothetical protein
MKRLMTLALLSFTLSACAPDGVFVSAICQDGAYKVIYQSLRELNEAQAEEMAVRAEASLCWSHDGIYKLHERRY